MTDQGETAVLTTAGLARTAALSAPLLGAALVASAPAGHAVVVDAHMSFVRGALTMLVAAWDEEDSGLTTRPAVVDAPIVLRLLLDLFDPGSLPALDASPAPAAPAVLPSPPASVAAPAAPARVRIPSSGLPAWDTPTPDHPPIARLPGGLELTQVERRGVMARVRADNGWEGWVAADLLESA